MTFIELDGDYYRLDLISRISKIRQRESNYFEFTITCDQTVYIFGTGGKIRRSDLDDMYTKLKELT